MFVVCDYTIDDVLVDGDNGDDADDNVCCYASVVDVDD